MLSGKLGKAKPGGGAMTAEQFRMWIAPISQFAGVLVVAGTLIFWGINLQERVGRLEAQVQAMLTSPSTQASGPRDISPACINLADQAARAMAERSRSGDSAAASITALMSDLGCMTKKLPQSN